MSRLYEIWSGEWAATGESGGPTFHGRAHGETFRDACVALAVRSKSFAANFDPEALTHWACRLFESREAALRRGNEALAPERIAAARDWLQRLASSEDEIDYRDEVETLRAALDAYEESVADDGEELIEPDDDDEDDDELEDEDLEDDEP